MMFFEDLLAFLEQEKQYLVDSFAGYGSFDTPAYEAYVARLQKYDEAIQSVNAWIVASDNIETVG